jgi:hypothetical protein
MHTEIVTQDVLVKQLLDVWDEIQRVTGRKDVYHEVDEFICNGCRFDHKDPADGYWRQENLTKIQLSTKIIILKN